MREVIRTWWFFTRYIHCKSIKILKFHYHELVGKIKDHEKIKIDGWQLYAKWSIRQK